MISSQFVDYKHLAYRLYAVFVHHGSVEFGHYYIYIFDFRRNVWRKYNDNEVAEIQELDEIFKNQGRSNPPTPYFLVYVNDALRDRLVDPVCRAIGNAPPELPPRPANEVNETNTDTAMGGVTATTTATSTTTTPTKEDQDHDQNMEPPSYDEAWADKQGTPGMGDDDLHPFRGTGVTAGGNHSSEGWHSSNETNTRDVQW